MKVLFLGDIVAKAGRRAIKEAIPKLREKHSPDLVIANVENAAHGAGITEDTLREIQDAGVDVMTSGNHIFKNKKGVPLLDDESIPIIRPANYPDRAPGRGYIFTEVGTKRVLIINVLGQVFFEENCDSPFEVLDKILEENKNEKRDFIIVDGHTEATSEARALGFHLDGRVSAVLGTHSHVQSADEQILPEGTAYITDTGMCGAKDSVLGVSVESSLEHFLTQLPVEFERPEMDSVVQGVVVDFDDENGKGKCIQRVNEFVKL